MALVRLLVWVRDVDLRSYWMEFKGTHNLHYFPDSSQLTGYLLTGKGQEECLQNKSLAKQIQAKKSEKNGRTHLVFNITVDLDKNDRGYQAAIKSAGKDPVTFLRSSIIDVSSIGINDDATINHYKFQSKEYLKYLTVYKAAYQKNGADEKKAIVAGLLAMCDAYLSTKGLPKRHRVSVVKLQTLLIPQNAASFDLNLIFRQLINYQLLSTIEILGQPSWRAAICPIGKCDFAAILEIGIAQISPHLEQAALAKKETGELDLERARSQSKGFLHRLRFTGNPGTGSSFTPSDPINIRLPGSNAGSGPTSFLSNLNAKSPNKSLTPPEPVTTQDPESVESELQFNPSPT